MNINEKVGVLGEITAIAYDQRNLTKAQRGINKIIQSLRSQFPEWARKINLMKAYQLGPVLFKQEFKNVICNAGFNAITKRLSGDTSDTGVINKAILGTGAGTPVASDTQLFTESYRNDIASATEASNIAFLTAYFTETETSGTFTEFGNCIDGTGTANTGLLWSHIAGFSWAKDTQTVLVVSCKYTFASV